MSLINNTNNGSSNIESAYRAAISLNNLACALQERRSDKQALETFQDSLSLMKMVSGALPIADVDLKLHCAHVRLSSVSSSCFCASSSSSSLKRNLPGTTFVLSDDSDCSTAVEAVSRCSGPAQHSSALMIRIEEYGSGTDCYSSRSVDVDCAIILHNFGVSYVHLTTSGCSVSGRDAFRLRHNAVRLLDMAQTLLAKASEECFDDEDNYDAHVMEKLLFVSLVCTKSTAQALMSLERMEIKVKECYQRLAQLKETVEHFGFGPVSSVAGASKTAAAAA